MRIYPYREQYIECKKRGVAISVDVKRPKPIKGVPCVCDADEFQVIICMRYKKQCSSAVCENDRIQKARALQFQTEYEDGKEN